jgi:NitT/TauT family transport system permease protein
MPDLAAAFKFAEPARPARLKRWLWPLGAGILLVALWSGLKHGLALPSTVLPSPAEILAAGWSERSRLLRSAWITLQAATLGFLAAGGAGFGLALILSSSIRLRRAIGPYVLIFQMTPVIILVPIYVLWLNQGLAAIVAVTFTICFFPVVANTMLGFAAVDRGLVELFAVCGAARKAEFLHLRVPSALPYFLTGMQIAGSLAPIGAITGEFLAGGAQDGVGGLGFMTIIYFSQLKTAELFAAGLAACLLGFMFVGLVRWLHWQLLHRWHPSTLSS